MSRGWLIEQEEYEVELMVSQNAMPSILRSHIVMSNDGRCLRSQFATLKDSENLRFQNSTSSGYGGRILQSFQSVKT